MSYSRFREAEPTIDLRAITQSRAQEINNTLLSLAKQKGLRGVSFIADSRGFQRAAGLTDEHDFHAVTKMANLNFSPDQDIEAARRQQRTSGRAVAILDTCRFVEEKSFLGTAFFEGNSSLVDDISLSREAIWRNSINHTKKLYSDLGIPLSNRFPQFLQVDRCFVCQWKVPNTPEYGFCTMAESESGADLAAKMFESVGTYAKVYAMWGQKDLVGVAGCREHTDNMRYLKKLLQQYSNLIPEMLEEAKSYVKAG